LQRPSPRRTMSSGDVGRYAVGHYAVRQGPRRQPRAHPRVRDAPWSGSGVQISRSACLDLMWLGLTSLDLTFVGSCSSPLSLCRAPVDVHAEGGHGGAEGWWQVCDGSVSERPHGLCRVLEHGSIVTDQVSLPERSSHKGARAAVARVARAAGLGLGRLRLACAVHVAIRIRDVAPCTSPRLGQSPDLSPPLYHCTVPHTPISLSIASRGALHADELRHASRETDYRIFERE